MTSEEEVKTNAKEESDCEIISSEEEKIEVKQESDCGIISADESGHSSDADDKTVKYYNDNPSIPIFISGKYSPTSSNFFDLLVDSPNLKLVCTKLPSFAEDNLAFVISCKQSDVPLSDISCDGHSGWVNDGVRKFTFFRNKEKKYSIVSKKRIPEDKMSPSHFILVRKYFHHRKYPDFKKMIAYARNFRDQICNDLVFLQYFFTGEIHSIKRIKHGNAKKATHSYCQTKPSVLEKARRNINSTAVRSVAANINDIGGVKHANNPADMITTKQLHDMKHNQSKSTRKQPHGGEDEISYEIYRYGPK